MEYIKRILILSNIENNENGGYLTLNKKNGFLNCCLKTTNLNCNKKYQLALSIDDISLSNIQINEDVKEFHFSLNNDLDISKKINALLLECDNYDSVLFGSTVGDKVENLNFLKEKTLNLLGPNNKDLLNCIDETNVENSIKANKQSETQEKNNKDSTQLIEKMNFDDEKSQDPPFFNLVQEQVEDMFKTYPQYSNLENVIQNSKWIKVDYDNDGLFYALGLIYEESTVKYICYAVPSTSNFAPPEHISDYCQWLEVKEDDNDGYYIMYQNAENGNNVKI